MYQGTGKTKTISVAICLTLDPYFKSIEWTTSLLLVLHFKPKKMFSCHIHFKLSMAVIEINVVCCVGRVEIQIEI